MDLAPSPPPRGQCEAYANTRGRASGYAPAYVRSAPRSLAKEENLGLGREAEVWLARAARGTVLCGHSHFVIFSCPKHATGVVTFRLPSRR
jgi:hypothetical protein